MVNYNVDKSKLNFFGEKHGKNDCAAMFSHFGGYLTNAEQSERVDSIEKICEIIKMAQENVNEEKQQKNAKKKNKDKTELKTTTILPIAWQITPDEESEYKSNHSKMDFNGITAYYCLSATSSNVNNATKIIYNYGISSNSNVYLSNGVLVVLQGVKIPKKIQQVIQQATKKILHLDKR